MKGWHSVFQTQDKAKVEEELRGSGQDFSWRGDDLRITSQQTAVETHPVTGQKIWFNHILVRFIWAGQVYACSCSNNNIILLCSFNLSRCSISQCCLQSSTECIGALAG